MPNSTPWFKLTIPDELLRKMTRAEYYAAMSWLRNCARAIAADLERK